MAEEIVQAFLRVSGSLSGRSVSLADKPATANPGEHVKLAVILCMILTACVLTADDFYKFTNYDPDLPEHNIDYDGFANPGGMARPQTWWHWMNGNVSKEGIRHDLEEMADKGYGAASVFSLKASIKGPVDYGSKEWLDLWSYSVETAAKLGMDIGLNNCDGWSEAGGPWITPEYSMKVTTWSIARVIGDGSVQTNTLAQPESKYDFYRDVAVVMWPAKRPQRLKMDGLLEKAFPATDESVLSENAGNKLFDGKRGESVQIGSPKPDFHVYGATFQFKEALDVSAFYGEILVHVEPPTLLFLEASDDGVEFKKVTQLEFEKPTLYKTFGPVKARYWRLAKYFDENPGPRTKSGLIGQNLIFFKELELLSPGEKTRMGSCISELPQKAGLVDLSDKTFSFEAVFDPEDSVVKETEVVVVKNAVSDGGKFTWKVPPGEWDVMRLGYTTTGHTTSPATPSGKGLELDKFSKAAVDLHFDKHIQRFVDAAGKHAGKTFRYVEADSWECGSQNWTQGFETLFEQENGYDILKFAPVLAGECVGSKEVTENFLHDYRNTMGKLVFENFYGHLRERVNAAATGLMYESEPSGEVFMRDQIRGFKYVDIPMSESWQKPREIGKIPEPSGRQTYVPAQTAARFYGKQYNAHESLTSELGNWAETPLLLKGVIDQILLTGANMLVFHSFVHQPDERRPGWAMEPHGTTLNRKMPWWPFSKPFFTYISRVQYMSQHGKMCSKVLFLTSDETPSTASSVLNPPKDVLFDMITGDGVREHLKVSNGRLVCPGKISYEILSVVPNANLTLGTLRQLKKYVTEGATISGFYQTEYRTLVGGDAAKKEWQKLNEELFGAPGRKEVRSIGKGRVFANYLCDEAAAQTGITPSIKISDENGEAEKIFWSMREHADGTVWYWLVNGGGDRREMVVTCDVAGMNAQLWNPENGSRSDVVAMETRDGWTSVPVSIDPYSTVFLVFRGDAKKEAASTIAVDGRERFPVLEKGAGAVNDLVKDFTMACTASPVKDRPRTVAATDGVIDIKSENFAVIPEGVHNKVPGPHAGAGLSIGKNSIAVFEHGAAYRTSVLVYDRPVEPGSRIAVVYKDNTPSLFVNGRLVQTGARSRLQVHPSMESAKSFSGELANFRVESRALNDAEIQDDMSFVSGGSGKLKSPVLSVAPTGRLSAEFFHAGNVRVTFPDGRVRDLSVDSLPKPIVVGPPFSVEFDENWCAPKSAVFDKLESWTKNTDPGIKNYSGIVKYTKEVGVPALTGDMHSYLEFDNIAEVARVTVNGRDMGVLWKMPYSLEITGALKEGKNRIVVEVANTWVNRCLYDATLPKEQRLTWSNSMESHFPSPDKIGAGESRRAWSQGPLDSGIIGGMRITFSKTSTASG